RRAVVARVARDDLRAPGHHARDLNRGLDGLGAAGGEEELLETARHDLEELLGDGGADIACERRADERELARLPADRLDDGRVLLPEVRAHELRREIQVALAGLVPEVDALGVRDVERLPALLEAPGAVGVAGGQLRDVAVHAWVSV